MGPGKYLSRDLFKKGESVKVKVAESCPTLCSPTDDTVPGILQARTLEWVAFPFSGGSSQPRDRTQVSCTAGGFFTSWAIREVPKRGKRQLNGLFVWVTGVNIETLTVTHLSLSRIACSSDSRRPAGRTHRRPRVKGPGRPSPTGTDASVSHLARPKAAWNAARQASLLRFQLLAVCLSANPLLGKRHWVLLAVLSSFRSSVRTRYLNWLRCYFS